VPVFEQGELRLFESGAIVLHIGTRCEALLPADPAARSRAVQWVFAALNSVEPLTEQLASLDLRHSDEAWARLRRPDLVALVQRRLATVSRVLEDGPYLDGRRFTAGDLIMTTVLRNTTADLVQAEARLAAYVARCTDRPAFQTALAAQIADIKGGNV
jgi:glutathione S-transferase